MANSEKPDAQSEAEIDGNKTVSDDSEQASSEQDQTIESDLTQDDSVAASGKKDLEDETVEAEALDTSESDKEPAEKLEVSEAESSEVEDRENQDVDAADDHENNTDENEVAEDIEQEVDVVDDEQTTDDQRDIIDAELEEIRDEDVEREADYEEPVETTTEKPAAATSTNQPAAEPQRSGFMPLFLGGVVAAVIGFVAGRGDMLDEFLPGGSEVDLAPLQEQIEAQAAANGALEEQIAALTAAVEAVENATPEPVEAPVDLSALTASLDALSARIENLEARPVVEAPSTDVATSDDLASLQTALDAQRAELAAVAERARLAEENATVEAQKVLAQAALTQVSTALESGSSFAPALASLEEVTPVEVPQALRDAAETGVTTLAELQDSFPEAARAALAAARAEIPESEVEGIGGFLKRQLSVRSVVPREGDDPDAVLSRAEAAVRQGSVDTALNELQSLPEAAQAVMREWIDMAANRQAAQSAAADLANSLTSN